jgi:hypothetical protein
MTIEDMYFELLGNKLEVVLIPAPDTRHSNHCIRAVQYANPKWYQDFCAMYPTSRARGKLSTIIKRRETISALEKIMQGATTGIYVERLLEFSAAMSKKQSAVAFETIIDDGEPLWF